MADMMHAGSKFLDADGYANYDSARFVNVLLAAKEAEAIKKKTITARAPPPAPPPTFAPSSVAGSSLAFSLSITALLGFVRNSR